MTKLSNDLNGRFSSELVLPHLTFYFPRGIDGKLIYDSVNHLGVCGYHEQYGMWGRNVPIMARIDTIVKPFGLRTATLGECMTEEFRKPFKSRFIVGPSGIIARGNEHEYKPNAVLAESLLPLVEEKVGRVQFPFIVRGFDIEETPDNRGYGWKVVPRADFVVVHDERLNGKYHFRRFSEVDDLDLPLFDDNGKFYWLARKNSFSGLLLGSEDAVSIHPDLAYSNGIGKVVLVRDENNF